MVVEVVVVVPMLMAMTVVEAVAMLMAMTVVEVVVMVMPVMVAIKITNALTSSRRSLLVLSSYDMFSVSKGTSIFWTSLVSNFLSRRLSMNFIRNSGDMDFNLIFARSFSKYSSLEIELSETQSNTA